MFISASFYHFQVDMKINWVDCPGEGSWHAEIYHKFGLASEAISAVADKKKGKIHFGAVSVTKVSSCLKPARNIATTKSRLSVITRFPASYLSLFLFLY